MRRFRQEKRLVNLFAFQDIMASVIGILFFIVLLMSLDIIDQNTTTDVTETTLSKEYDDLQAESIILKNKLGQLRSDIEKIVIDTNLASIGDEYIFNETKDLHTTLSSLYQKIEEQQKQLIDIEDRSEDQKKEYTDNIMLLEQLMQDRISLKEQLRLAENRPPIAYIIDKTIPLEPWLVELSGHAIRVAASDGQSAILEFTSLEHETRKQRFFAWAKSQNPSTHYFVILKKPSGLQYEDEFEEIIEELGFEIGTDLIPEGYITF